MSRLPKEITKALEETGMEWEIVKGTNHRKIMVGGKFVGILPHNKIRSRDRATKNVVAQIRRAAHEDSADCTTR